MSRFGLSRKCRLVIFVVLGLFLLIVTCMVLDSALSSYLKRSEVHSSSRSKWVVFTNNACGYIAHFPNWPFENPIELEKKDSVVSYRQFASTIGEDHAFMVATLITSITNDFTEDETRTLLEQSLKGVIKEGDEMLGGREVRLGVNLGREIEVGKSDGSYVRMRFYQVGHDVQEVVVRVPMADRNSPSIAWFFDSFRLLQDQGSP